MPIGEEEYHGPPSSSTWDHAGVSDLLDLDTIVRLNSELAQNTRLTSATQSDFGRSPPFSDTIDQVSETANRDTVMDDSEDQYGNQEVVQFRSGYKIISETPMKPQSTSNEEHRFDRRLTEINRDSRTRPLTSAPGNTSTIEEDNDKTRRRYRPGDLCDKSTHTFDRPKGILIGKNLSAKCHYCKATVVHTELPAIVRVPCQGTDLFNDSEKSRFAHRLKQSSNSDMIVCMKVGCELSFQAENVVWRTPKERTLRRKAKEEE
ncbi:hypothetical protein I203_106262 [Kwoniella mangroviensis CBS 8507]|uniref:uncharacterized protein n=1 Tax=Kwoniella mangroviensis CBS 8507 TaxID=1296122 RepID=UPI00080D4127|nr:uncharacterized protein I203_04735 [Kwoniella mangroviensis CBS 8507]OCF66402.1 hypothetical protein I203_04735 [Kwoniella mangroviensis CBS 8507]